MKDKPTAFLISLGLLAILFGLFGIVLVIYLHINPIPQLPNSASPYVRFMGTAWAVISNGALAVAGLGILLLKNWGRILAILYAIFAIVGHILKSATIPEQIVNQVPPENVFIVIVVPLVLWVTLIIILKQPSIIRQFNDSGILSELPSIEKESIPNEEKSVTGNISIGWGGFGWRFLCAYLIYAIVSHTFSPYPMTMNINNPLKLLVYYSAGYLSMFLITYFVISVPIVIVAKIIPAYRNIVIPQLLNNAIGPSLIIGMILIYGGRG